MTRRMTLAILASLAGLVLDPPASRACVACYGASDAPMAQGMNWGIISLLGIIGLVLAGVASFFVFLARRAEAASTAAVPAASSRVPAEPLAEPA